MSKKEKSLSAKDKYIFHLHTQIKALEVALKDTQDDKLLYRNWLEQILKKVKEPNHTIHDILNELDTFRNYQRLYYGTLEENNQLTMKIEAMEKQYSDSILKIRDNMLDSK